MNEKPGRLGVGVIGAGRVGTVLASALRAAGHEIVAVSGGSTSTIDRVEALLPGVEVVDILEVARRSDLVMVCVPDDAIADVVGWVAAQGGFRPGQLVLHTSGRFGAGVLQAAVAAGAIPLAVHPAMTFTGTSIDLRRIVGAPFAVTAPVPVQPIGQALVVELGGEPVLLPEDARPAYHAALSHASNHLVTLLVQAREILGGVRTDDDDAASRLLGPLTRAALEGALTSGAHALTGPVSRGDAGTVAEHLAVVDRLGDDLGTAASYRTLADATARLAASRGRIGPQQEAALRRLLRRTAPGDDGDSDDGGSSTAPAAPVRSGRGPAVVHTVAQLRAARALMAGEVVLVPTMGALHDGHLELVRAARRVAEHVVVSIFVNPTQFGDATDLDAYPRTLDADVAALAALGGDAPDLVYAPSAQEMYPAGTTTITLDPGPMAERYEGAARPGHFAGMLTVVAKLLHQVTPDGAVFGEKDAQQLAIVRQMVTDLDWPTWILSVPVVRAADGLALSSRNARLSPAGRERALALHRAVAAAQRLAGAGADVAQVLAGARAELDDVEVDYVDIVGPDLLPLTEFAGRPPGSPAVLVLAAGVDGVRLLDTGHLTPPR